MSVSELQRSVELASSFTPNSIFLLCIIILVSDKLRTSKSNQWCHQSPKAKPCEGDENNTLKCINCSELWACEGRADDEAKQTSEQTLTATSQWQRQSEEQSEIWNVTVMGSDVWLHLQRQSRRTDANIRTPQTCRAFPLEDKTSF